MDAQATPDLIVRYLRELSADLVAAAVVGRDGQTLAGPAVLGDAAGRVAQAAGGAPLVELRDGRHLVVLGRGDVHLLVAVHTRHALAGLVRHDVLTALRDLGDAVPGQAQDGRRVV